MSILNTVVCSAAGGNTGIADCSLTLKNVIGGFLAPASFELTAEQLVSAETVLAALIAAVNNDNPALRIYPLPETVTFTDNSEDVVLQTFGFGAAVPVRDGKYNLTFQYTRGGNCINNALQKFNSGNYRYIGFDAAGVLFGTKVGTSLKGIPLDYFYAAPFKFNDGANVALFAYRISFNPAYINSGLGFIPMNVADLLSINGLQNIVFTLVAARAAGVFRLRATTGCAGTDLYALYGAELADAANFVVTRLGNAVTITSVAQDPNTSSFLFTLDATDPDYNVAGPFVVNTAATSVLAGNGVEGYEGIAITVA